MIKGQPAFESSIYDKSNLVSTVLQDTDGQFIGLSVAEDLAFALENDVMELSLMREKSPNLVREAGFIRAFAASAPGFIRRSKAAR